MLDVSLRQRVTKFFYFVVIINTKVIPNVLQFNRTLLTHTETKEYVSLFLTKREEGGNIRESDL